MLSADSGIRAPVASDIATPISDFQALSHVQLGLPVLAWDYQFVYELLQSVPATVRILKHHIRKTQNKIDPLKPINYPIRKSFDGHKFLPLY